jgi:Ca-activated chloride channel family protein
MRSRLWLLALTPLLFGFDLLQSPNRAVENGNARMKGGKAEEALAEYDKAVQAMPAEPGAHFNRGAALYALSRFDEASAEFLRATEAKTSALKASAFYNLGNSYFKTDKYDDAIAAYRRSLTLEPNDVRAKWNLELAQKKKKDEEQKKKNDEKNKDQNKDDKNKDKKDDQSKNDDKKDDQKDKQDKQDKKDEQAKNDEKKDQQKEPQKDQKKDEPKDQKKDEQAKADQQKPEKAAADMREIEAVLDSLERSPKDLEKERARLRAIRRAPPSKDW